MSGQQYIDMICTPGTFVSHAVFSKKYLHGVTKMYGRACFVANRPSRVDGRTIINRGVKGAAKRGEEGDKWSGGGLKLGGEIVWAGAVGLECHLLFSRAYIIRGPVLKYTQRVLARTTPTVYGMG